MTADPFDTPIDPFDLPAFDPQTGELLEPETVDAEVVEESALVPVGLAGAALDAVRYVDHDQVTAFASDLTAALDARVAATYDRIASDRPEGAITAEVVAPELSWLADAAQVFDTIGKAFTGQARSVKSLAGDVVQEVHADRDLERAGGSASVKVGAAGSPGQAVKVTATQPTETFTDTPAIVDVLTAHALSAADGDLWESDAAAYAAGARHMASVLLGLDGQIGLLAAPKWKSTGLDTLRGILQAGGPIGVALAGRLAAAYGRRPKGAVQVSIERTDMRETRTL